MKEINFIAFALAAMFSVVSCAEKANPENQKPAAKPEADFTFTVTEGSGEVTFTNKSKNATSYEWEFGDEEGYSTEENPVYTYKKSGDYEVVLTAINGKDINSKTQKVTVKIVDKKPALAISIDGNFEDWKDIPWREDIELGGAMTNLKIAATANDVYVLIEGTKEMGEKPLKSAVGFDLDNNLTTGWNDCPFTKDKIAGADCMQELAGFYVWGWRAEEKHVGWDWIEDNWMKWQSGLVDGKTYMEWKLDIKYAKTHVLSNSIFKVEGQDYSKFASTVSDDVVKMYIWFRDESWKYYASAPKEGGVPFEVKLNQYKELN